MRSDERRTAAIVAVLLVLLFLELGRYVIASGEPAWLLGPEHAMVNHGTLVAWMVTWLGYIEVLVPLSIIVLIVGWRYPQWRTQAIFSVVMLLLSWRLADLFQHIFARPRRLDWVVRHETSFSYPSSHAAIAFGFYALWGAFLWYSDLPRNVRLAGALGAVALALAICWSRLALGAHYMTDIAGGVLLATALVSAGAALLPIKVLGRPAGRP